MFGMSSGGIAGLWGGQAGPPAAAHHRSLSLFIGRHGDKLAISIKLL
jgi:hypothetical protein